MGSKAAIGDEILAAMSGGLVKWQDPVFGGPVLEVPGALAARLDEMAEEIRGRHIYYERMHALLALTGGGTDPASFQLSEPPTDAERAFGAALGQAFHQGCQLADIALATGISPDSLIEIGKRTIRRTKWLQRI